MRLNLENYEEKTSDAVKLFWGNRNAATNAQKTAGVSDRGERAGVTAGKNMDGFFDLISTILISNGPANLQVHLKKKVVTLPGYFRQTKQWDIVAIHEERLVAVIELKSQVGPSFGNNFNNRTEEAIGSAVDFWMAFREGAFGDQMRPFLGWLMLVEDCHASQKQVTATSPHFELFDVFHKASYLKRYDMLCQRLAKEGLYSHACLMASPRSSIEDGIYESFSQMTSLKSFISALAGHSAIYTT